MAPSERSERGAGWGYCHVATTPPGCSLSLAATLPLRGRDKRGPLRAQIPIYLSNSQRCAPGRLRAPGCPFVFLCPFKMGGRAPTGAGADTPHPSDPTSRSGRSPDRRRSLAGSPASAPLGAPPRRPCAGSTAGQSLRRAALSRGPSLGFAFARFVLSGSSEPPPQRHSAWPFKTAVEEGPEPLPSASSWQGVNSAPGRSLDAARVREVQALARGRRTGRGPRFPWRRPPRELPCSPGYPLVRPTSLMPHEAPSWWTRLGRRMGTPRSAVNCRCSTPEYQPAVTVKARLPQVRK